jgi:hypothetical protein
MMPFLDTSYHHDCVIHLTYSSLHVVLPYLQQPNVPDLNLLIFPYLPYCNRIATTRATVRLPRIAGSHAHRRGVFSRHNEQRT